MSAGSLRERVAEAIREHAPDEGDCICSEYVLDVPHAAHLADAVLAEVRAWLASNEAREVVAEALRTENADTLKYRGIPDGGWEPMFSRAVLAALIDQTKED